MPAALTSAEVLRKSRRVEREVLIVVAPWWFRVLGRE
jgi:hypothetical protein